ncbi:LptF/LptG family permease [Thiovibrio sp. JS02]
MPLLLYTYIATEILAPFFASFLVLNGILFLGRLVPLLDSIFGFGIGAADFLRMCAYILPKLMLFSIPMASMMGVIIAITRMVGDNEVMALKAGGIGLLRLLPPVIAVSLATALLAYFSAVSLIPQGTVAMKNLFFKLAKEKIDRGIQPRQFSEGLSKVVLYVDAVDPVSKQWQGVYLSDLRHEKTPLTIVAKSGSLTTRMEAMQLRLNLADGTMNRASGDVTQTIHFDRYQLNLPITTPAEIAGTSVHDVGKNGMTQAQLLAMAKKFGAKSDKGLPLLIEYHTRMALPVGCFILSVLGLSLAMLSRPGRRPVGVPLGLACFIIYYILFTAGKAGCEGGKWPVFVGVWLPNVLIALFTFFLTRQVANESSRFFFDRLLSRGLELIARLPGGKARGK